MSTVQDNDKAIDYTKWAEDLKNISDTPPADGQILETLDGVPVKLTIELKEGASPFIFGRANVPDLFGVDLGWYLQGKDNDSFHGWKCVLMTRARTDLVKKLGLGEIDEARQESAVYVKSLRVIRMSQSGHSLLCEVHEYLPEEEEKQEDDDS